MMDRMNSIAVRNNFHVFGGSIIYKIIVIQSYYSYCGQSPQHLLHSIKESGKKCMKDYINKSYNLKEQLYNNVCFLSRKFGTWRQLRLASRQAHLGIKSKNS